ncbi:hypothetical protein [Nonomuraea soli]|uniref:Uncharacterized protein n=1 Tax=Nonomuraea soli TaxID=1032476 RepID=A0A7W0CKQ2_9ACTN|nr:hypothetical protein [Nonomuraea soli]MBA2892986.1 hypothetical protein [Nonomuraea soli]
MTKRRLLDELNRATTPTARPNVLVALWRWRYELGAAITIVLVVTTVGPLPLAVPLLLLLWPPGRSEVWGRIRCVIVAHRIRVGFVQAYLVNRRGQIPVIAWCAPAPWGERAWVWCRAGITPGEIADRPEVIATACWAHSVEVLPHPRKPHWVLLEIVRG